MTINWLFLKKILWNMLCLLCNTTQAADNNKVLSEENKRLVWKFFKNSQLFDISDEKKKILKTPFQPKSLWNVPVAFNLLNVWILLSYDLKLPVITSCIQIMCDAYILWFDDTTGKSSIYVLHFCNLFCGPTCSCKKCHLLVMCQLFSR